MAWGGTAVLAAGLVGCSGDTTSPAGLTPAQVFFTLALNYHAINLALTPPYDTVRLTTTARSAAGTVINESGRVTYRATDSTVTVDSTGLVTAHYVTAQTKVIATRTVHGTTQTDTTVVAVTPNAFPMPLATFSIQPMPDGLDSARAAVNTCGCNLNNFNGNIPIYATINTGDPATDTVCNVNGCGVNGNSLAVYYWSSNPTVATIDRSYGYVNFGTVPDTVTFFVETYAYGVAKRDSLQFLITYPELDVISLQAVPAIGRPGKVMEIVPSTATVVVGARLWFETEVSGFLGYHPISDSVTFVFDDSTFVPSGPLEVKYKPINHPYDYRADFPSVANGRIPIFFSDTNQFFFEIDATRVGDFTYHLQGSPGTYHIIVKSGL
jgi:hypothetical protein